jgi:hypothetical protein
MPIPIKDTQDEETVRKILEKVIQRANFNITFSGIVNGEAIFDLTDLKIKDFAVADKIREAMKPKQK